MNIIGSLVVSSKHLPGLAPYCETFGHRISLSPIAKGDDFELLIQVVEPHDKLDPLATPVPPATIVDSPESVSDLDTSSGAPSDTLKQPDIESDPQAQLEESGPASSPDPLELIGPSLSNNCPVPIEQDPGEPATTQTTSGDTIPENDEEADDEGSSGDSIPTTTPPLDLSPSPAGPTAQLLPLPESELMRAKIADLRGNDGSVLVLFGNIPAGEKVILEGTHAERRSAQRIFRQFIPELELEFTIREIDGRMRRVCRAVDVIAALSAFLPPVFYAPD